MKPIARMFQQATFVGLLNVETKGTIQQVFYRDMSNHDAVG